MYDDIRLVGDFSILAYLLTYLVHLFSPLHAALFWVNLWTCPHVQLFSFISLFTDLLRVSFGFLSFSFQLVSMSSLPLGWKLGAFYLYMYMFI